MAIRLIQENLAMIEDLLAGQAGFGFIAQDFIREAESLDASPKLSQLSNKVGISADLVLPGVMARVKRGQTNWEIQFCRPDNLGRKLGLSNIRDDKGKLMSPTPIEKIEVDAEEGPVRGLKWVRNDEKEYPIIILTVGIEMHGCPFPYYYSLSISLPGGDTKVGLCLSGREMSSLLDCLDAEGYDLAEFHNHVIYESKALPRLEAAWASVKK